MNKIHLHFFNDELEKIARRRRRRKKFKLKMPSIRPWASKRFGKDKVEKMNDKLKTMAAFKAAVALGKYI